MKRQDAKDASGPEEPTEELDRIATAVVAAAIEVHHIVYEHALCFELGLRNLPYRRQVPIAVA